MEIQMSSKFQVPSFKFQVQQVEAKTELQAATSDSELET
jgi:hypothetical protein